MDARTKHKKYIRQIYDFFDNKALKKKIVKARQL